MPVLSPSVMNESSPMTGRESLLVTGLPRESSLVSVGTMMSGRLIPAGSRFGSETGRGVPAKSGFGISTLSGMVSAALAAAANANVERARERVRGSMMTGDRSRETGDRLETLIDADGRQRIQSKIPSSS